MVGYGLGLDVLRLYHADALMGVVLELELELPRRCVVVATTTVGMSHKFMHVHSENDTANMLFMVFSSGEQEEK